jgi:hypothetical protein
MQLENNAQNVFFLIKTMRIVRGFRLVSIRELMTRAKNYLNYIMTLKIEMDNDNMSLE